MLRSIHVAFNFKNITLAVCGRDGLETGNTNYIYGKTLREIGIGDLIFLGQLACTREVNSQICCLRICKSLVTH